MTLFFLRLLSALLARLPLPVVKALAVGIGEAVFLLSRQRRRIVLSNLSHAFPERDGKWLIATGRKSVHQMIEFGMLAAVLPSCGEERLRKLFSISPESRNRILEKNELLRPVVVLAPHLGPQEALCLLPLLVSGLDGIGAIYRPLDNPALDQWIRESRERFGLRLFSRKRGLQEAIRTLKSGHWLGLLFDQSSGSKGGLMTFLDRVASVTELPGILVERHQSETLFLYAARLGFWQIELCVEPGPATADRNAVNFLANQWLENLLRNNEDLLPSWLWAHHRWRPKRRPELSLREKKNRLQEQNAFLGRAAVPRTERFFIRLPDRLIELTLLLPLLRAIRKSRPDVAITVLGRPEFLPLVERFGLCEEVVALPSRGFGYFGFFWRLRRRFPTAQFLFADSFRSDLEAWLIGAPHRFGIQLERRRRLLNYRWTPPEELTKRGHSRLQLWEAFLRAQRLEGPVDATPFALGSRSRGKDAVALICGGWSAEEGINWIEQILAGDPQGRIFLFGAADEQAVAARVAKRFSSDQVTNCVGQSTIEDWIDQLGNCRAAVGRNGDGIHLANAIGVPVVVLSDCKSAESELPFFAAPKRSLPSGSDADAIVEAIFGA